jgi:hypothetical protein
MDDVDAAVIIPAGVYDMDRTSWISVRGFAPATASQLLTTLADGVAITNLLSITGLFVRPAATSGTTPITLADTQTLTLNGTRLAPAATSAQRVLTVSGHAYLHMSDEVIIAPTDGGRVIELQSGATLEVNIDGAQAQLIAGTILGDGTTTLDVFIGADSAVFGWPQVFFTGAFLYVQRNAYWAANNGDPNGILTAAQGAIYTDYGSGTLWQNTNGATAWSVRASGNPTISLINSNAGTASAGSPVYSSSDGHFDLAKADALATSALIIGLVQTDILPAASGVIQDAGGLTLTTAQWDARVTGQVGGLTAGSMYYVDPAAAGKLTITPTVTGGQVRAPIGFALSTTLMLIRVSTPSNIVLI